MKFSMHHNMGYLYACHLVLNSSVCTCYLVLSLLGPHQVHFLDAILSHNSTDDHIKEFISQGGMKPLLDLLSLPALPVDFATSSACGAITGACRAMLVSL